MIVLIFILSLVGIMVVMIRPELADLLLVFGPCALASLVLLLQQLRQGWFRRSRPAPKVAKRWVILDGSNVMHWKDGKPRIETVRTVMSHFFANGYNVSIVFDANAGYLTSGHYLHDSGFADALGISQDRVIVVPKGTPADPIILAAARDRGARIVTNDRFRDWAGDYPEVRTRGHLIRGGFKSGRLWLNLRTKAK